MPIYGLRILVANEHNQPKYDWLGIRENVCCRIPVEVIEWICEHDTLDEASMNWRSYWKKYFTTNLIEAKIALRNYNRLLHENDEWKGEYHRSCWNGLAEMIVVRQ